jgi:hypothetical protein
MILFQYLLLEQLVFGSLCQKLEGCLILKNRGGVRTGTIPYRSTHAAIGYFKYLLEEI